MLKYCRTTQCVVNYFTKLACSMMKSDRISPRIDFAQAAKCLYCIYTIEIWPEKCERIRRNINSNDKPQNGRVVARIVVDILTNTPIQPANIAFATQWQT